MPDNSDDKPCIPIRLNLEDWEWDICDAFAAAEGLDRNTFMRRIIVEQAERVLDGTDPLWDAGDRQCKSPKLN